MLCELAYYDVILRIQLLLLDNILLTVSLQFSYLVAQLQYFICPVEYDSEMNRFTMECQRSDLFMLQEYSLHPMVQSVLGWVRTCRGRGGLSMSENN